MDQIEELKQAEEKFEKEKKAKVESAERIEKQKKEIKIEEGLATLNRISNELIQSRWTIGNSLNEFVSKF